MLSTATSCEVLINIGAMPVLIRSTDAEFLAILEERYSGFTGSAAHPVFEIEMEIVPPGKISLAEDAEVNLVGGLWVIERGDFRAELDPAAGRGRIRQSANPYSIDSALRILHSLLLVKEGGLLVHGASAIRNGRAFVFSGVSGAGKTTLSRLAPADANLLTDEISYLRREGDAYFAWGTPFAGELAKVGENLRAPLEVLYLLEQGPVNRIDPVPAAQAVRALLRNVLFFARDPALVQAVFRAACELVERVPVRRLTFLPDARVWELIV